MLQAHSASLVLTMFVVRSTIMVRSRASDSTLFFGLLSTKWFAPNRMILSAFLARSLQMLQVRGQGSLPHTGTLLLAWLTRSSRYCQRQGFALFHWYAPPLVTSLQLDRNYDCDQDNDRGRQQRGGD